LKTLSVRIAYISAELTSLPILLVGVLTGAVMFGPECLSVHRLNVGIGQISSENPDYWWTMEKPITLVHTKGDYENGKV